MSTGALRPGINPDLAEWYFVWDWWPVPQFLLPLLGADGCRTFVDGLSERCVHSRLLVSFALAIEHRESPIISESDLDECLARICAPDYDFRSAKSLESAVGNARWTDIVEKNRNPVEQTLRLSNGPEALRRAMVAKSLPSGRVENVALIRKILAGGTNE